MLQDGPTIQQTEEQVDNGKKRKVEDEAQQQDDVVPTIEDINVNNYVKHREYYEKSRLNRLLKIKAEKEKLELQKKELDVLEKYLKNQPETESEAVTEPIEPIVVESPTPEEKQETEDEEKYIVVDEEDDLMMMAAQPPKKKKTISSTVVLNELVKQQDQENIIKINVGGKVFQTTTVTLQKRENFFKTMLNSDFHIDRDENGAILISDRNPDYFPIILEHLRTGSTTMIGIPEEENIDTLNKLNELLDESDFFGLSKLSNRLKTLITDLENNLKNNGLLLVSNTQNEESSSNKDEQINNKMVTVNPEQNDLDWIQNFIELTLNEKEKSDIYLNDLENEVLKTKLDLEQKEQEILFILSNEKNIGRTVVFNVSGVKHSIPISKIVAHEECILNTLLKKVNLQQTNGEIFIDRDPEIFGYIITFLLTSNCDHFPTQIYKRRQIYREAKILKLNSLLDFFNPTRYPIETIGTESRRMKEEEDMLRHLFATDRSNPLLNDPYLHLIHVFENEKTRESFKRDEFSNNIEVGQPAIPLLFDFEDPMEAKELTEKSGITKPSIPIICSSRSDFITQFNAFTFGIFKDVDWSNLFCAGGSVLASALHVKESDLKDCTSERESIYYNYRMRKRMFMRNQMVEEDTDEDMEDVEAWDELDDALEEEEEAEEEEREEGYFTDSSDDSNNFYQQPFGSIGGMFGVKQKKDPEPELTKDQQLAFYYMNSYWRKSDIDLFLYACSEKEAEEKIQYLFTTFKNNLNSTTQQYYSNNFEKEKSINNYYSYRRRMAMNRMEEEKKKSEDDDILVIRTGNSVTFYFQYPIRPVQVVLRIYKSPSEILMGFDCDSVCFGFDGNQLLCLPRARRALKYRINLVDPDRQSTTYELRLLKYAKRGFRVAVPGYDPKKVKNTLLMGSENIRQTKYTYYRGALGYASLTNMSGLARLLLFRQAMKVLYKTKIFAAIGGKKSISKTITSIEKMKNPKKDYIELKIPYSSFYTPRVNYNNIDRVVKFFLDELQHKPFFIYKLNDVQSVLHVPDKDNDSTLKNDVEWITIEPGRQYVGSFNPTTNNFYKDAYNKTVKPKPYQHQVVEIPKKYVKYAWKWDSGKSGFLNYKDDVSMEIEKAYRLFKKNHSPTTVDVSDQHYIDFGSMKQVNKTDHKRTRRVQREKLRTTLKVKRGNKLYDAPQQQQQLPFAFGLGATPFGFGGGLITTAAVKRKTIEEDEDDEYYEDSME
ncbi:hypothetical protein ABK040_005242 [Willaertia magna]